MSFPGGSVPVRGRQHPGRAGRDRRHRRRVRLGQDADRDGDRRPAAASARMTASRFALFGEDPRPLSDGQRRRLLGRSLAVVYQDPMSALNPALRVGRQLGEVAEVHEGLSRREARSAASTGCVRCASAIARGACSPVPARVLRRHAPACRDRDGADGRAEADHRRRADDRTRRDRAAADPALLRDVDRLRRRSGDLHLARRRRRLAAVQPRARDVRRPHRRGARRRHARRRARRIRTPPRSSPRCRRWIPTATRPLASIPGRAPGPFDDAPGCPFAPRCPRATDRCRKEMPPLEQLRADASRRVLASERGYSASRIRSERGPCGEDALA